jgi:hypothetical protein
MTVSDLSEQPCNKSDNAIKLVPSCQQLVPNLLQQLGTSSANTTCRQLVNIFVTTCTQICDNLCVFTCVGGYDYLFFCKKCLMWQTNTSLFTSCRQVVFALLVSSCWNKLLTLLTILMALSDLLQGCSNKSDTVMI